MDQELFLFSATALGLTVIICFLPAARERGDGDPRLLFTNCDWKEIMAHAYSQWSETSLMTVHRCKRGSEIQSLPGSCFLATIVHWLGRKNRLEGTASCSILQYTSVWVQPFMLKFNKHNLEKNVMSLLKFLYLDMVYISCIYIFFSVILENFSEWQTLGIITNINEKLFNFFVIKLWITWTI